MVIVGMDGMDTLVEMRLLRKRRLLRIGGGTKSVRRIQAKRMWKRARKTSMVVTSMIRMANLTTVMRQKSHTGDSLWTRCYIRVPGPAFREAMSTMEGAKKEKIGITVLARSTGSSSRKESSFTAFE